MADNKRFARIIDAYDESKKKHLVELGQGVKPYNDILVYLKNEIALSTKKTAFNYKLLCFKEDGAFQLNKAIEELYGAATNKGDSTPSDGEKPINMIDVKLMDGTRIKVPFGKIETPDLGEDSHIDINYDMNSNMLLIQGVCQFRFSSLIDQIIHRTEEKLNSESIYKNQAIEIDANYSPKAINLTNIDKEFMILSKQTEMQLVPLKARILQPEKCIAMNIPLKYGALMEGAYGLTKVNI